jgi:hypothetical protein
MILIAALAVSTLMLQSVDWFARIPDSLAICYDETLQLFHFRPWRYPSFTPSRMLRLIVQRAASETGFLVSCLLSSLVPCLLITRLRQPRPPLKLVIRQPGFAVCAVLILGALAIVDLHYLFGIDLRPTVVVLASWTIMLWIVAALPPWRSEPSWIDRAGRAAGVGWIIASFLVSVMYWLG